MADPSFVFWLIWTTAVFITLCFGWVVFFGAPYIPTLRPQRKLAIELLDLRKGQLFVDLGCGDGSMLILAAQRGCRAVGYEINPVMAIVAWLRTRRHRKLVKVVYGSFWRADISEADGIFVFLIGRYMAKLSRFFDGHAKDGLKVVSNAFQLPGRKPVKKQSGLFLYRFTAKH